MTSMIKTEWVIRPGRPTDAARIAEFQIAMALETEGLKLDPETCRRGVNAVFEQPTRGEYLVAESASAEGASEAEGELVGCLLTLPEWSDWRNGTVWWVHSVYVMKMMRGRGVFAELYRYLQRRVQDDPASRGIRLYVDKRNVAAQRVYETLGMSNEHYELFEWLKPAH